jgi:hypothetical protein
MQLGDNQANFLEQYLKHFRPLMGDKRTERTFRATVQGIMGAETLKCSRIAAFSPCANRGEPQRPPTSTPYG